MILLFVFNLQSRNSVSNQPQGPSLASMLSGNGTATAHGNTPQSLEQLLERQWEQGSQFLMEQAQHFDSKFIFMRFVIGIKISLNNNSELNIAVASLLSCLHQLRSENIRLEEHVNNLVARRDHLLAVNARLAIPLNQVPQVQNQSACEYKSYFVFSKFGLRTIEQIEGKLAVKFFYFIFVLF